jgi:hypothetical protein
MSPLVIIAGIVGTLVIAALALLFERVLKAIVLAVASALGLVLASGIDWHAPITPLDLMRLAGLCLVAAIILAFIRHEVRAWRGLDQWPNPRGRYYDRWWKLPPEDQSDYYAWLAREKDWQEPWASWARMAEEMEADSTKAHFEG